MATALEPYWDRDGDDPREPSTSIPYVCLDCEFTGGTMSAFDHHAETGHAVKGKHWPASMGAAHFSDAGPDGRRQQRKTA